MRTSLLALALAAGLAVTPVFAAPPLNPGVSVPLTSSTGFIGRTVVDSKGKVIGTFFGVLLTGIISNALNMLQVNPYFQDVAIGALILVSLAVSALSQRGKRA